MSNLLVFGIFVTLLSLAGGLILLYKKLQEVLKPSDDQNQKVLTEWLSNMQSSLDRTRETLDKQLSSSQKNLVEHLQQSNKSVNERLDKAASVIAGVQKELGGLAETTGYIKDVYQVLQAPKLRGNIGEQILNDLLKETIPHGRFSLQYQFSSGERVDALIETGEGKIPIDAKFPMESFRRYINTSGKEKGVAGKQFENDCRKHIRDIANKYILPAEGTVDFAIMYIPSEPVAYEINNTFPELLEYAYQKRVTAVSPNQFFSFLRVIMIGFEKQQVGEKAKLILQSLQAIKKEAEKFEDDFTILQKHITNAKAKSDEAAQGFGRLSSKIAGAQAVKSLTS
ncbi:MAG: DNA recombination protein RmuC [bacterium]